MQVRHCVSRQGNKRDVTLIALERVVITGSSVIMGTSRTMAVFGMRRKSFNAVVATVVMSKIQPETGSNRPRQRGTHEHQAQYQDERGVHMPFCCHVPNYTYWPVYATPGRPDRQHRPHKLADFWDSCGLDWLLPDG